MTAQYQDFIDGLRKMADFLEAHQLTKLDGAYGVNMYARSPEDLREAVRLLGSCEKKVNGDYLWFRKHFSPTVYLDVNCNHELVCKRVLKGTKVIPATEAQVIEVPAKPERVEEVYEWICPDSILRPADLDIAEALDRR